MHKSFIVKIVVCFILITYTHISVQAQDTAFVSRPLKQDFAKNAFTLTLGMVPAVFSMGEINYERMLREGKDEKIQSMWLSVGAGGFADWGEAAMVYNAKISFLTGHQKKHLEYGFGLGFTNGYDIKIFPSVLLGYRYQKPIGGLVFRTGVGLPEMIYVSLGYCL